MAIVSQFIAGTYSWTFAGNPIGVISDAARIIVPYEADEVVGDNMGATVQDLILRGGNGRILLRCAEAGKAAVKAIKQQMNQISGDSIAFPAGITSLSSVGRLASSHAKPLIGKRVKADRGLYATIEMNCAIWAPGANPEWLQGARLDELPMAFMGLPFFYDSESGNTVTIKFT